MRQGLSLMRTSRAKADRFDANGGPGYVSAARDPEFPEGTKVQKSGSGPVTQQQPDNMPQTAGHVLYRIFCTRREKAYFFSALSFLAICSMSFGLSSASTLSTMLARASLSRADESAVEDWTWSCAKSTRPACSTARGETSVGSEGCAAI